MKQTLTKKQKAMLDYIRAFSKENGYPPSFREIMNGLKYSSVATVAQHIDNLVAKRYLAKRDNEARSIQLVEADVEVDEGVGLPVMGLIAAGEPITVLDQAQETLAVPPFMIRSANSYVLQVKGNSMIEDGIHDGDYVIIREQQTAQNGDTVVAMVNGYSATLKRFYREKGGVRLQPANSSMEPIILGSEDSLEIQGIVTGLLRTF